jgi:hypothetical protein
VCVVISINERLKKSSPSCLSNVRRVPGSKNGFENVENRPIRNFSETVFGPVLTPWYTEHRTNGCFFFYRKLCFTIYFYSYITYLYDQRLLLSVFTNQLNRTRLEHFDTNVPIRDPSKCLDLEHRVCECLWKRSMLRVLQNSQQ